MRDDICSAYCRYSIHCQKKTIVLHDPDKIICSSERAEKYHFCRWWPWPLTLTFKLVWARGQTRLRCEFGANPFSDSRYISYTNKNTQTDGAKNRTFRSSLRAVIKLVAGNTCMIIDN